MDCRKLCKMKFVLLLLSIQTVASGEMFEHAYTKKCMKRLEESNSAYQTSIEGKNTQVYSVFRPDDNGLSFHELYESYQSKHGKVAPNTMLTIITMRKRNKNIPDDKNANMLDFITALQKYDTNKTENIFVVNNMIVTIYSVEECYLAGLSTIRNTSEKIRRSLSECNMMLINNLIVLAFEYFKEHMFDCIYAHARQIGFEIEEKKGEKTNKSDLIESNYENKYSEFFENTQRNFLTQMKTNGILHDLEDIEGCKSFKKLQAEYREFEKNAQFVYLTGKTNDDATLKDYLIYDGYDDILRQNIIKIATEGFELMKKAGSQQKSKDAFSMTCMKLLDAFVEIPQSAYKKCLWVQQQENFVDNFRGSIFEDIYNPYFAAIGFDSLQDKYRNSTKNNFEVLRKRLEPQDETTIVIEGMYAKKDIYSLSSALEFENIFTELDKCHALYLYKKRTIETGIDDVKALEAKKRKMDTESITESTFRADKMSKRKSTIDAELECDENATKQDKTQMEISIVRKNVFYNKQGALSIICSSDNCEINETNLAKPIPTEVESSLRQCLDNSNRKPTDLYEIAVKSKWCDSLIYVLNYTEDNDEEITSLIYDIRNKSFMGKDTSELQEDRRVICLDNVPEFLVDSLVKYLQKLQWTGATEFRPPNMFSVGSNNIIYTESCLWFSELDKKKPNIKDIFDCLKTSRSSNHLLCQYATSDIQVNRNTISNNVRKVTDFCCKIGYDASVIEHILSQLLANSDFICNELNDPYVIKNHSTENFVELYTTCAPDKSQILHICVWKTNNSTGSSFIKPLRLLRYVLNNKHNKVILESLNNIEEEMKLKQKIITTIIHFMCKKKYFDIKLEHSWPYMMKYELKEDLQDAKCVFVYSDEWGDANSTDKTKPGIELEFYTSLNELMEPHIDDIIKMLLYAEDALKKTSPLKVLSFKISADTSPEEKEDSNNDTTGITYVTRENLDCFDMSEKYFDENLKRCYCKKRCSCSD